MEQEEDKSKDSDDSDDSTDSDDSDPTVFKSRHKEEAHCGVMYIFIKNWFGRQKVVAAQQLFV